MNKKTENIINKNEFLMEIDTDKTSTPIETIKNSLKNLKNLIK